MKKLKAVIWFLVFLIAFLTCVLMWQNKRISVEENIKKELTLATERLNAENRYLLFSLEETEKELKLIGTHDPAKLNWIKDNQDLVKEVLKEVGK